MLRRISAWIMLAAFLLLIVNIVFIGYHRAISALIYAAVAVLFLLMNKRR